jgi:hypothetical protein
MNKPQLTFFGKLGRIIAPSVNRAEPVFWFREVRLLRKLESGEAHEVRRVTLRRGLNIVWAPPEESDDAQLYGDGLSGHASGKTLFCRILRYLLGESSYGSKFLRDEVEKKFEKELWAVAEVFIRGQLWMVARPLAVPSHRFAIKNGTIEGLLAGGLERGDYSKFFDALEENVCTPIAEGKEANEQFRWRYLLPWLTRDQECRYAALTEWRSSLAESENPQTSVPAQQELMKAVLDILDAEEPNLRSGISDADDKMKQANAELPGLDKTAKRDHKRLVDALRRAGIENLDGSEALKDLLTRKMSRLDVLKEAIELMDKDEGLAGAQTIWQNALTARARLSGRIEEATKVRDESEKAWKGLASKRQREVASKIPKPSRAEDKMCPWTWDEAKRRGCVKDSDGPSAETKYGLGETLAEADDPKSILDRKNQELTGLQAEVVKFQSSQDAAFAKLQSEQKRVDGMKAQYVRLKEALEATDDTFNRAEESAKEVAETTGIRDAAMKVKDECRQRLDTIRLSHEDNLLRFSNVFADGVRAAMGGQVNVSVRLLDRGISLSINRNGELTGAALETIKVIAFDVAAMVQSMEGVGHHPRFLIHDGPREADMARIIYDRFFLFARKLEESVCADGEPAFQYILTTTTPPPKDMRDGTPWLRLVLNTAKTDERLLKADL